jgi:hypothetical protein
LARQYPPTKEGPRVAVEGIETPRRLVLFTTENTSLNEANELLHKEGRGRSAASPKRSRTSAPGRLFPMTGR